MESGCTEFDEISHVSYATGHNSKFVLYESIHSVIQLKRYLKIARWGVDVIIHNHLGKCVTTQTLLILA
jgi:hypothetical protein